MAAWSRLQQQFSHARVLIAVSSLEASAHDCEERSDGVRVLLDPQQQTAKRYNALWLPRAYALDERGTVCYVQPETTPDSHAPLEVEALWRGQDSSLRARGTRAEKGAVR